MSTNSRDPRPTHRLKMLHKTSNRSAEVGAGWLNGDGSVSIRLNPGVELSWRDGSDCILTLFPVDKPVEEAPPEYMLPPEYKP